ncbi:E3 ubiquitin-protein ligase TRIM39-like [Rhinatrema bivittatum]|uniref:E3 ubiquitin-protein ligase TRIM39-like n=1 Tax=Rhinatrema bivittatum TaxID=194408 RepID=UPI00112DF470|nr:E3 ubiquitin-protein ligase TRIM39-like [Rhinatrema bivittatum]
MKLLRWFPAGGMAAATPTESLRDEASCPICLDYFTDPVITKCGHNFCRACITQTWEGIDANFPCPQCRKRSRQRNLRPNRQLAKVIEIAKKLSHSSDGQNEENLCEEHEENLKLFCEEDQAPICVVCDRSRDHKSHTVVPIEEAVQEYKKKLQLRAETLRKQLEDLVKCKSNEEKQAEELRRETQIKRQKIETDFEELQQFLTEEKRILLSGLEGEERKILQRIGENVTRLEEQSSAIRLLVSEIEEKSQQPAAELLKDMKNTLSRCQSMEFPEPEAVSTDLEMGFPLSYPQQLKKMITSFGGLEWWMERGRYAADVTLDPETAHPELILSEDGRNVRCETKRRNLPRSPRRFNVSLCVLGQEGFASGRHYWEVEVGEGREWELGVCRNSVRRKGWITRSPGEGYWAVKLLRGSGFCALTSPRTELPLSETPRAVGILLDREAGEVSFYDADNKSRLYTFAHAFTGTLRPYFCTYGALRIRPVPGWE